MGDEIQMGDRGVGGNNFRTADDEVVIAFFFHVHKYVGHLIGRAVPVDRRMDDGLVPVQNLFLRLVLLAPGFS